MTTEAQATPAIATPKMLVGERAIIIAVALGAMLAPLNSTMIAVALPRITGEFSSGAANAGWLVTAYLIIMAALQPVAGKLGDRLGRRWMILGGLAGFGLASLGAAFATNLAMLIVLRAAQAAAGSLAFPNAVALLREVVPAERRASTSGMVGAAVSVAAAVGPPLGGVLVSAAGWRAIFFVNLVLVAPALLIGWRSIPNSKPARETRRFDLLGSVFLSGLLVGTAALLMPGHHDTLTMTIGGIALAIGLAIFLWYELRHPDPALQPRLFKRRAFAAANAAVGLSNLSMYVTLLALPVYLGARAGWDSARIGLVLMAMSAGSVLLAPVGGRLADRYGRRWPTVAGMALLTLGLLPLALSGANANEFALLGGLGLAGIGLGLSSASLQTSAVEAVEQRQAGVASGVFSTSRYLGSIVGSSLLAGMLGVARDGGQFGAIFALVVAAAIAATLASIALADRPTA